MFIIKFLLVSDIIKQQMIEILVCGYTNVLIFKLEVLTLECVGPTLKGFIEKFVWQVTSFAWRNEYFIYTKCKNNDDVTISI